jgi:hypothetical protein
MQYLNPKPSTSQEMESMQGGDVFGGFYNKLRDLREYHKKFPNLYYDQGPADTEVNLAHDLNPKP